jgi:hypothetical protein
MFYKLSAVVAVAGLLAISGTEGRASTLASTSLEDTTISSWGIPNSSFYGQTITTGAASLDNVMFRINDFGTTTNFDLHVYAWNGSTTTGSNLAGASGVTSGVSGMSDVSVATGGISLGAGSYLIGFQATAGSGGNQWGGVTSASVPGGGRFYYQNNGGNASMLLGGSFSTWSVPNTSFSFTFDSAMAPVPLPAGGLLLLSGLMGIGVMRTRRKKAQGLTA